MGSFMLKIAVHFDPSINHKVISTRLSLQEIEINMAFCNYEEVVTSPIVEQRNTATDRKER
jgi:hypothetical protein